MRVNATTRIACPPEKVFDLLADLRNDTEWNSRRDVPKQYASFKALCER